MLPSGREKHVADDESLARFAISKSQFSRVTNRPKPNLLSPTPHVELSLSRIDALDSGTIQELGDDVAAKRGKEKALGYAELEAKSPRSVGLDTISDEPPPHHANITGWSDAADPAEKKRMQLEKAKLLVEKCQMRYFQIVPPQ